MKTFFKYDYYLQCFIFIAYLLGWILMEFFELDFGNYFLSFYYVVGGAQLISFLIRLLMKYPKNWMYTLYGILIVPIWLILFYELKTGNAGDLFFSLLFLALFYSPFLAVFYIFYNYKTYQSLK